MNSPRFLIVTPTFQSQDFLDECIHSIASQAGDFEIRYHIQDGGSKDDTWEIVQRWQKVIAENSRLFPCRLILTAEQVSDAGMYDAIMKGFARLRPRAGDIMTWLNSDDLLAAGALKAVAGCMAANPTVALCGGRTALIDANSRLEHAGAPILRSQSLMAAGLYDGRKLPFIMQEGTFWTGQLWKRVGGLNPQFRLAGDWDLWRRMAEHAPYVVLDALTGFHRRRPGQLSGDIDAYHAEVDAALVGEAGERYEQQFQAYERVSPDSLNFDVSTFPGLIGTVDAETGAWTLKNAYAEPLPPPITITSSSRSLGLRGEVTSGCRGAEGPYPDQGLPAGVRWVDQAVAGLQFPTPTAGWVRVRLTCRPSSFQTHVRLECGSETLLSVLVSPQTPDRDQVLEFDLWASPGDNPVQLKTRIEDGDPELRLLIVDLCYELVGSGRIGPMLSASGPAVVVAAAGQTQGLARTLRSLAAQTLRPSSLNVILTSDEASVRAVVEGIAGVAVQDLSERDLSQAIIETVLGAEAENSMVLQAGQELTAGALQGASQMLEVGDASAVVGATLVFDECQRGHSRFRSCRTRPWMADAEAWRLISGAPSIIQGGWEDVAAYLEVRGLNAWEAPLVVDVIRGFQDSLASPGPLRVLWLAMPEDGEAQALGVALSRIGLDVRQVTLPSDPGRASKSAVFHHHAWAPTFTLATSSAHSTLGATSDDLSIYVFDPAQTDRFTHPGHPTASQQALLRLALAIGELVGDTEQFRLTDRATDERGSMVATPLADKFGGQAIGLSAFGPVDLAKIWTARAGFGDEHKPNLRANLPMPFRWIEQSKAQIGVYSASAGLRRLVIWIRTSAKEQRLILRCRGEQVHETATGGGSLSQDRRISALVTMTAGWNEVELEFSSTVSSGGHTRAALITGVDIKPGRRRDIGPLGDWSYVSGADFEENPYPQFGLFKAFRWSLNPCVIRIVPERAGRCLVTVRYQSAVGPQTLTASVGGVVVGRETAETADLSVVRSLAFQLDMPAEGADTTFEVDRTLQDGRDLAFIIDRVTVEVLDDDAPPLRIGSSPRPSARRVLKRLASKVGARLRAIRPSR